jgi:hypothetical protein
LVLWGFEKNERDEDQTCNMKNARKGLRVFWTSVIWKKDPTGGF